MMTSSIYDEETEAERNSKNAALPEAIYTRKIIIKSTQQKGIFQENYYRWLLGCSVI